MPGLGNGTADGDASELKGLIAAAETFTKLAEHLKGKHITWLRQLLKTDAAAHEDLGSMSVTNRSMLEFEADQLLRGLVALKEFNAKRESMNAMILTSGDELNEFCSGYVPLAKAMESDSQCAALGVENGSELVAAASAVIERSARKLTKSLIQAKTKITDSPMFGRQQRLAELLKSDELESDKMKALLPTPDTYQQDEVFMSHVSQGAGYFQPG